MDVRNSVIKSLAVAARAAVSGWMPDVACAAAMPYARGACRERIDARGHEEGGAGAAGRFGDRPR